MYKYYMPQKIHSNIQGINSLIRIYNKLLLVEDIEIALNFKNTIWFSGEMLALFGAMTYDLHNKHNKKIYIENLSNDVENLFKGNGFCEVIHNMKNGKIKEYAIKFEHFENILKNDNKNCFNDYLAQELLPKLELEKEEIDYILSYFSELFINARTHGNTDEIFCCGQKYANINKIRFMIVDLGIGIPSNVRKIQNLDDKECIKWSIAKGNTTKNKDEDVGGLGLSNIIEFIEKHNGDLSIISLKGEYNYKMNILKNMLYKFDGTIVYIDFDFTMLDDVDEMFKLIKKDKNNWNF